MNPDFSVRLHYRATGSGPWVTLLHSLGSDHSIWEAQAVALSKRFSVLAVDLRGHGQSPAPEGAYTLEMLAADVVQLWDELGVTRSHVIGISLGGFVAQHLGFDSPDRVARLVLADTCAAYPTEAAAAWPERIRQVSEQGTTPLVAGTLERWFTAAWRAEHPEALAAIGHLIAQTPRAGYVGCCHAIARLDTRKRLAEVRASSLVIVGEQDLGTPPALARELAGLIADARLEVLPGAAHMSCIEQAGEFNRLLDAFLR
ncbi:MAG: 3-oxoadipate enol-lactonase [Betaproteobacteria bacterium]|nr:3-oxoadipate enol-lactonase [Betaproteobacteria bacterium]